MAQASAQTSIPGMLEAIQTNLNQLRVIFGVTAGTASPMSTSAAPPRRSTGTRHSTRHSTTAALPAAGQPAATGIAPRKPVGKVNRKASTAAKARWALLKADALAAGMTPMQLRAQRKRQGVPTFRVVTPARKAA